MTAPVPPFPPPTALARARGPSLRDRLALRALRLLGWTVVVADPVPPRCVIIFYPHTSNWDFVVGLLAKWAIGIDFRWLGKHTLFATPLRRWFVRWGGIPVDRGNPAGLAEEVARMFRGHGEFRLVITPEGTRRRTDHWKSGFHRIARAAGVPLGLGFLDRTTRTIGIGGWMDVTGDAEADLEVMRAFYAGKRGWCPANAGTIAFRDAGARPSTPSPG